MRRGVPRRTRRARALPLVLVALLAACAAADPRSRIRGALLEQPLTRPAFTLTDTGGRPFDFRAQTAGRLTLLYFGFTHCDDICPATMGHIAGALRTLPPDLAARTRVVFVTVDPARDTPALLRAWLDHFSRAFVGLSGPDSTVTRVERALELPVTEKGPVAPDGSYDMGHSAEIVAFAPDGRAHVVYTAAATQDDFRNDLPLILAAWPAPR